MPTSRRHSCISLDLFLDEPTEGLDPRSRAAVWDSLDELRRQLGMTLVLTTHYMEEADRLCDRIGIIDRGQLITEGTPRDLKSRVGNEALVVKFADEADTQEVARAERALAAVDDARHVQVAGQDVSIFVDDAAAIAPKALRALELAAVTPRSIAITQPTLEDVDLATLGRAFAAPAERRRGKDRRMSASAQTLLLARRALIQFPRNPILLGFSIMPVLMMYLVFGGLFAGVADLPGFPTDNYFRYLAPTAVLLATVPGIGNAGVALAGDFQSRYFYKLLSAPVSLGVIMYGRLLGDCVRLAVQATLVLVLALALGAHVATGPAGAALMIVMATLLGIVTFGVLSANLAIRTKDAAAVQAVQPMAFLLIFLDERLPNDRSHRQRRGAHTHRSQSGRACPSPHARPDAHRLRLGRDRHGICRDRRSGADRAAPHRPKLPARVRMTETAWTDLHGPLRGFVGRRVRDPDAADDIAQAPPAPASQFHGPA